MMDEQTLLTELRAAVTDTLSRTEGVLALRADHGGAAPHLFKPGDDLADLVIAPRYPMAMILDTLGDAWPEARLGVVLRGCDERALIELAKRNQVNLENIEIVGFACSAEQTTECRCATVRGREICVCTDCYDKDVSDDAPVTCLDDGSCDADGDGVRDCSCTDAAGDPGLVDCECPSAG